MRATVSRPLSATYSPPRTPRQSSAGGLQLGARVHHEKFGEGVILDCEGEGRHARVQVNFATEGNKWLVMEYANLQVL
jgi:DNA helicase-2/ATP-dependent DNA helicase PcrA